MAVQDLDYRFGPRRPVKDNVMSHPRTYPQDEQRSDFEAYASNAKGAPPQALAPQLQSYVIPQAKAV